MSEPVRITENAQRALLYCGVAILVVIGVTAAAGRVWFLTHSGINYDQFRSLLPATEWHFVGEVNTWFATHSILTYAHIVPGSLFLILGPFQFSSHIRNRYVRFHRWSGRVIIISAISVGLSGLVLGATFPFGGLLATSAIFIAGTFFLVAVGSAYIAIRRGDVVRHREWMIRMFSIGIAISTIRIVSLILLPIVTSSFELRMGLSFWLGFGLTFAAGEFWVRHTRLRSVTVSLIGA